MDVYVLKDGKRTGPFLPFRLREMVEDGSLQPGDQVWHEGMDGWKPLSETESLKAVLNREEAAVRTVEDQDEPRDTPLPTALRRAPEDIQRDAIFALLRARRSVASRRFFARQIDTFLAGLAGVGVAVALGHGDIWQLHLPENWTFLVLPALAWMLLEPFCIAFFGTTPGKAALGLRVESANGGKVSLGQAWIRSLLVWLGGMGLGVRPANFLPVVQWGYSWWMYQRRGTTLWDHTAKTTVNAVPLQRRHGIALAVLAAGYMAFFAWLSLAAPIPSRMTDEDKASLLQMRKQMEDAGK